MTASTVDCCSACGSSFDVEDLDPDAPRVAEAARLLDEVVPDWFRVLDLTRLRMVSRFDCVLGQLYDEYNVGLWALEVALEDRYHAGDVRDALRAFGGFVDEHLWYREVDARRAREATS